MCTLYLQVIRDMRQTIDNIEEEVRSEERADLLYHIRELCGQADRFRKAVESTL